MSGREVNYYYFKRHYHLERPEIINLTAKYLRLLIKLQMSRVSVLPLPLSTVYILHIIIQSTGTIDNRIATLLLSSSSYNHREWIKSVKCQTLS